MISCAHKKELGAGCSPGALWPARIPEASNVLVTVKKCNLGAGANLEHHHKSSQQPRGGTVDFALKTEHFWALREETACDTEREISIPHEVLHHLGVLLDSAYSTFCHDRKSFRVYGAGRLVSFFSGSMYPL